MQRPEAKVQAVPIARTKGLVRRQWGVRHIPIALSQHQVGGDGEGKEAHIASQDEEGEVQDARQPAVAAQGSAPVQPAQHMRVRCCVIYEYVHCWCMGRPQAPAVMTLGKGGASAWHR